MVSSTNPISITSGTVPVMRDLPSDRNQLGPVSRPESREATNGESRFDGITKPELEGLVQEINRAIFGDNERMEFQIHERTGRMLVKLVDQETDEVIREIPPEKMLNLIANIWEMVGILVDERG